MAIRIRRRGTNLRGWLPSLVCHDSNAPAGWRDFGMIRSLAFTTQGRLHCKDIEVFLMPGVLKDTNLFLWVDMEAATQQEIHLVLEEVFHFPPLSIEDCVAA